MRVARTNRLSAPRCFHMAHSVLCRPVAARGERKTQMKSRFVVVPVALLAFALAPPAAAQDPTSNAWPECPVADVGRLCTSTSLTCIPATCCDDPSGCVASDDAGSGSSGASSGAGSSGSSSSGGVTGKGTRRACAVCQFLSGTYCPPSTVGDPCPLPNGGVCMASGGGGGEAVTLDGGIASVSFAFTTCFRGVDPVDFDAGKSSSSSGAPVGSTSSSGTSGSSGGNASSSGGTSGGGSSGGPSGSSGASSGTDGAGDQDGGADNGVPQSGQTSGCSVSAAQHGEGFGPLLAFVATCLFRRRRNALPR